MPRNSNATDILQEHGLDSAIHLFGHFYINRSIYKRLLASFESVVIPSLITKAYGRWAILAGFINHSSFISFILTNLTYAAPEVAAIAGIVRFTYVFIKTLYNGEPIKTALQQAGKDAIRTAIKFFLVYSGWALAVALATTLGVLSGPLLPLGLLLVGVLTSVAFTLASFIVDRLPVFFAEPQKTWQKFQTKLQQIKACLLPGLLEGVAWTLMENPLVSISSHIAGFAGKLLDCAGISLIVSSCFFIGAVIHCSVSRWITEKKNLQPVTHEQKIGLQETIAKGIEEKQSPTDVLNSLKGKTNDAQLTTTLMQYVQITRILNTVAEAQQNPVIENQEQANIEQGIDDVPHHSRIKRWLTLPLTTGIASDLKQFNKITKSSAPDKNKTNNIFKKLEQRRGESMAKLNKIGFFNTGNGASPAMDDGSLGNHFVPVPAVKG